MIIPNKKYTIPIQLNIEAYTEESNHKIAILIDSTELISKIPNDFVIVAESGINSYEQIKNYNNIGIYNFLIGESILKSDNYANKIKELKG